MVGRLEVRDWVDAIESHDRVQPLGYLAWADGDPKPRHLFPQPSGEMNGQISPDGSWIAYEAVVSSRSEIFVSSFPDPGRRYQVSTGGGLDPLWSKDGREMFFRQGTKLLSVGVTPGTTFSATTPRGVHEGRFLRSNNNQTSWSVTPDGSRFLRLQPQESARPVTRIDVVLDWFEEFKTLVVTRRSRP